MSEIKLQYEVDYSYKIMNKILTFKEYKNREEVLAVAASMVKLARSNPDYSDEVKNAYVGAFDKLNLLNFNEMKEIISILKI